MSVEAFLRETVYKITIVECVAAAIFFAESIGD